MFDRMVQSRLQPALIWLARGLARQGWTANRLTLLGLAAGLAGCCALAAGWPLLALGGWGFNRLCDGLDGPLARLQEHPSPFGAYLDILADMIIYGGLVCAHALAYPEHGVLAAFLLGSFLACSTSFLGAAIITPPARQSAAPIKKGFFYDRGLAEGLETIVALSLMIVRPDWFPVITVMFAGLCWLTVLQRILLQYHSMITNDAATAPANHGD